jgi:hypothetical protein
MWRDVLGLPMLHGTTHCVALVDLGVLVTDTSANYALALGVTAEQAAAVAWLMLEGGSERAT